MLEASARGEFAKGKVDPREAGRRGAQVREERWHERLTKHREELDKITPRAIETLGKVIDGDRKPDVSSTAFGILDRWDSLLVEARHPPSTGTSTLGWHVGLSRRN